MRRFRLLAGLLVFAAFAGAQTPNTAVARIVAVGDVHGDFDAFVAVLRSAGVIDKSNKWSGGATWLVQTGDCVDRGADSRKVLDLLINLERQAAKSKGRVYSLLGNHEAMNVYGDLRYVSAGEYNSYRTSDSADLRDRAYEVFADPALKDSEDYRKTWNDEHPLGWVEHRQAFAPNGKYGRVLLERDAIVKVNDILFLHGGISQKYASTPMLDLNRKIRAELRDFRLLPGGIVLDDDGPLWSRTLASDPEPETAGLVDAILNSFGVSHIVIGHTPTSGAITPRFGGKVIQIDVDSRASTTSRPPA
jgi:hypothetical protein